MPRATTHNVAKLVEAVKHSQHLTFATLGNQRRLEERLTNSNVSQCH